MTLFISSRQFNATISEGLQNDGLNEGLLRGIVVANPRTLIGASYFLSVSENLRPAAAEAAPSHGIFRGPCICPTTKQ